MTLKEKISDILGKLFSAENRKYIVLFGGTALGIIVLILLIVFVVKVFFSKITYEETEEVMEKAAYKYMQENMELLPSENATYEISADTLIEGKYMKSLKKYLKDKSCTGRVVVKNELNTYKYQGLLSCNKFETTVFVDKLKKDNTIALTGDGLYQIDTDLVFRGQNPNNYAVFANRSWRIVKLDASNNVYLILNDFKYDKNVELSLEWDNRYNVERKGNRGVNTYTLSRAVTYLNNIYNSGFSGKQKNYIIPRDLCVGKRYESNVGWQPTMECSNLFPNQYVSLLPLYEFMRASLDETCALSDNRQCLNYNYLTSIKNNWWTLTANADNTFEAYQIKSSGYVEAVACSSKAYMRYVIALDKDVLYDKGSGTVDDPYYLR